MRIATEKGLTREESSEREREIGREMVRESGFNWLISRPCFVDLSENNFVLFNI